MDARETPDSDIAEHSSAPQIHKTGLMIVPIPALVISRVDVTYNVPDPVAKPAFQLLVSLQEPEAQERPPPMPPSSAEGPRGDRPPADDDDPAAAQHLQEYKVTLEVCTR
ncbi:C3 and PZP-like alpha-2-macroglobulin domain-containing protein 8 [Plecturocebus cupreus]